MTTTVAPVTALDILKETRQMFAETHWASGVLYRITDKGKKQFCMVGGLCHVFAKNALPEWINADSPIQSFYVSDRDSYTNLNKYSADHFIPVLDAEQELVRTINPSLSEDFLSDPQNVERTIIEWNDGEAALEFRDRGNASYVLEVMDATIERVEKEQNS